MRMGERVLFYHSVVGKEIVGIARVVAEAYPDPTATDGEWSCVDLEPEVSFEKPVTLETLKVHPTLKDIALIRQSRLSVMPLEATAFEEIVRLSSGR